MKKVFGNKKAIAVFVLPAFLLYVIFGLVPIVYNIYISFFRTNLMEPGEFVNIQNYVNLFKDNIL